MCEILYNKRLLIAKIFFKVMKTGINRRVFIIGVGMTKFLKPSEQNPEYD